MSHEQMLAWLDQASAGTVRGAADRLVAAAKEIREIAEELKVRPQYVEWKGEGADAFRTWSGDLANATLRLGDFGEDSGAWLGHASDAIAQAQASIPRDKAGAQANLDAATVAHNDPDAATVTHTSTTELAALAADKEKVRQEAAAQMTKLGQAYQLSATQLDGLERPRFPPPPAAIMPEKLTPIDARISLARSGSTHQVSALAVVGSAFVTHGPGAASDVAPTGQTRRSSRGAAPPERPTLGDVAPPTRVDIDSVATLPHSPLTRVDSADHPPLPARADGGVTPPIGLIPPGSEGGAGTPASPAGPRRAAATGRASVLPGQGVPAANPGRVPGGTGIVGGRPVTPPSGRPMGAIPRGTVAGDEGTAECGPIGPARTPVDRQTQVPGRALTSGGVVGSSSQQPRRAQASPATRGVSGAPGNAGAAVRGGISGGAPSAVRLGQDRSGGTSRTKPPSTPRTDTKSGRPRRPVEDEETWWQRGRRTVPPVID
ncbi:translation initiation factor IF-2 [Streptomyces sp. NPDC005122]